jgi:hypothetical protein
VTLGIGAFLVISVMMTGLLYYLLYLFTGREGWLWPIAGFYALAFAAGVAYVLGSGATGIAMTRWGAQTAYAGRPGPAVGVFLGVAFLLPPILGALAHGSFFFRVKAPMARYRVGLVSLGILAWFVIAIVLGVPALADVDAVQAGGRLVTLLSILSVVAAYFPPRWVGARLGVASPEEGDAHAPRGGIDEETWRKRNREQAERLQERVRDLV